MSLPVDPSRGVVFEQFFDATSCTFTYLLASRAGGEALLIDPVKDHVARYLEVIQALDLRLVHAIDTHTHADHITALGDLRTATACSTIMGERSKALCVSANVRDGEVIALDGLTLTALYTPGHTDESFSFVLKLADEDTPLAVFTGDTLLIKGSGRTDFQGGDADRSWDSIVNKLFTLPASTIVYPGHDYKGCTASTIGEERRHNPRFAGKTQAEYVAIMNGLHLPNPAMMDVAIPANLACGQPDGPPGMTGS